MLTYCLFFVLFANSISGKPQYIYSPYHYSYPTILSYPISTRYAIPYINDLSVTQTGVNVGGLNNIGELSVGSVTGSFGNGGNGNLIATTGGTASIGTQPGDFGGTINRPGDEGGPGSDVCRDTFSGCSSSNVLKNCYNPDPQTEEWIQDNCAKTCGKCTAGGSRTPICQDLDKNCSNPSTIKNCHHPQQKDYMIRNCAKTCDFCSSAGSGSTTIGGGTFGGSDGGVGADPWAFPGGLQGPLIVSGGIHHNN